MNFRSASKADLNKIEKMLRLFDLPYEDCKHHLNHFVVVEENGEIIGTGGMELYGDIVLLRSFAVCKKYRNKAIGKRIYFKIKGSAIEQGVREIYLLTETAEQYFEKLGFNSINRDLVPEPIKQTKQFSSLCPASAIVMKSVVS